MNKKHDNIHHPFMIKALVKPEIERMYLYIINVIYNKSKANVTQNGEKLKTIPLT
jgi:hypothetical protein